MGKHGVEDGDLTRVLYELAQSVDRFTAATDILNANVAINNELLRAQEDKEDEQSYTVTGESGTFKVS
jgi:hypothetical protein